MARRSRTTRFTGWRPCRSRRVRLSHFSSHLEMNMMRRSFLGFLTSLAFIGSANAEGEAEARKAASTAQLKKEGVPFIDHLPTIETEAESRRRTKDEVVKRAIALVIVA